jgi:YgiT-type zinc finger domain-containing protein
MNLDYISCPMCHVGKLQERYVTHSQIFEGQLVVINHVPAMVCDVCGERILDSDVLARLSGLLGTEQQDRRLLTPRF